MQKGNLKVTFRNTEEDYFGDNHEGNETVELLRDDIQNVCMIHMTESHAAYILSVHLKSEDKPRLLATGRGQCLDHDLGDDFVALTRKFGACDYVRRSDVSEMNDTLFNGAENPRYTLTKEDAVALANEPKQTAGPGRGFI